MLDDADEGLVAPHALRFAFCLAFAVPPLFFTFTILFFRLDRKSHVDVEEVLSKQVVDGLSDGGTGRRLSSTQRVRALHANTRIPGSWPQSLVSHVGMTLSQGGR